MFLVAARACTVTVLLTAAAVRAEEVGNRLRPTPYSDPVAAMPWLRCEPTPIPHANPCQSRAMGPVDRPARDSTAEQARASASREQAPRRTALRGIDHLPLVLFWESRSGALFLGVDRHGVGGVHFGQRTITKGGEERTTPALQRTGWQRQDPSRR